MEVNSKKADLWHLFFSVTAVVAFVSITKIIWSNSNALITAVAAVCGAVTGFLSYFPFKKCSFAGKCGGYLVFFCLIIGAIFCSIKFTSDEYIVSKQWNTVSAGSVSFDYHSVFSPLYDGELNNIPDMQAYMNDEGGRYAMYMVYDIENNTPSMQSSFAGAIASSLESMSATDLNWLEREEKENSILGIYSYKIDKKELKGLSFIYKNGTHFEMISFTSYSRNYSDDYLNKVKESIKWQEF